MELKDFWDDFIVKNGVCFDCLDELTLKEMIELIGWSSFRELLLSSLFEIFLPTSLC